MEQTLTDGLSAPTHSTHIDIAIIGAGIGGLYCGLQIKKANAGDFRIFEASRHIGGRIWSMRVLTDGVALDDKIGVEKLSGSSSRFTEQGGTREVEFCAEFGPMRIEPKLQPLLCTLIKELELQDDLQSFPPYQSPSSRHDPQYELVGEEAEQATPLDLLQLGLVRILGKLHTTQHHKADGASPDVFERRYVKRLNRKLQRLVEQLTRAVATRQTTWSDTLQAWVKTLTDFDYQLIRQYTFFDEGLDPDGQPLCTPLWKIGFWNLLGAVLSHHAVMKIRDLGAFYHVIHENPNGAEWVIFWLRGLATSDDLKGLRGGMQRITEVMVKNHSLPVHTGRKLVDIAETKAGPIKLVFDAYDDKGTPIGTEAYTADQVILALPFAALRELAILNAAHLYEQFPRDIAAVISIPLLKLFFSVKQRWWDEDVSYTNRYATMLPSREIHYISSPLAQSHKGLVLVYTDPPASTFWSNYIKHREMDAPSPPGAVTLPTGVQNEPDKGRPHENPRLCAKVLQYMAQFGLRRDFSDLEMYAIRDWGRQPSMGAFHAWLPERESWRFLQRLSGFKIGRYCRDTHESAPETFNMHVCGEAYSDYQGFIEGALRSADHVLHTLDASKFPRTPMPWLCDKACRYADTEQELQRMLGKTDCTPVPSSSTAVQP